MSTFGDARVNLSGVTANNNYGTGVRAWAISGYAATTIAGADVMPPWYLDPGNASVSLNGVTANGNEGGVAVGAVPLFLGGGGVSVMAASQFGDA